MNPTRKRKKTVPNRFYFSPHLTGMLSGMLQAGTTVVSAPSGFGKTTAVREYLRNNLPRGARERWYTCLGEPPSVAWAGICRLFDVLGVDLSERLAACFPLTKASFPDIAALMHECHCETETFLVVDNYQLFENEIPRDVINAFSVHASGPLHLIVITQPLAAGTGSVHNANIHQLGPGDLLFDRDGIAQLFRLSGTKLSRGDIDRVQVYSEGWVAAIRLQIESYRRIGAFTSAGADNLDELIQTAIWNRMSDEQRNFLMSLSLLDGFTGKQAAGMNAPQEETPVLPRALARLLEHNFFIPYVADKRVYSMHSLLRDFLLKRFEDAPPDFARAMLRRAGAACEAVSDYFGAARFYMRIRDFDAVLRMPFTHQYLDSLRETDIIGLLERFTDECPEETCMKVPLHIPAIAFYFMRHGRPQYFARMLGVLRKRIDEPEGLLPHALSLLRSEYAMLMSFAQYNDIAKMSAYHREALTFLTDGESSVVWNLAASGKYSWAFGITSVLCLFWRDAGKLDEELSLMDECMPFYYRLTDGHGMGAEKVMRAEACLLRGDAAGAEVAAYAACHQASVSQQISMRLCAELVLVRAAILRGDRAAYSDAVRGIARYADTAPAMPLRRLVELCLATTELTLGVTEDMPEWLRSVEGIRHALYVQAQPYGLMLYGRYLLLEHRYTELYGLTETVMNLARGMHYVLPQVFQMIYLAAAKQNEGETAQAADYLGEALDLALPDGIVLPFAEFGETLRPLFEASGRYPARLKALCKRQAAGVKSVVKFGVREEVQVPLSTSERKIALLAKEGLSSAEIASRLLLSQNTVRSAFKGIYAKLNIHSRFDLMKKKL